MSFDLYKQIYLIGIGGIGMSAVARYFNANGKIVSGYDQFKSNLCNELEKEGIVIHYNDNVDQIPSLIKKAVSNEVLVIYTPAISLDNSILSFFKNNRFKIYKRAEVLGIISKQSFTIAIAGTHGKTTTSTILAHIFKKSGKESTAFLGGISRNYNTNLLIAKQGNVLIVEADEYDRSFLEIHADIAVITSLDPDHLDIYKNEEALQKAFIDFVSQMKKKGLLLVHNSIKINFPKPIGGTKLTYSAKNKADFFAENIRIVDGKMNFDLLVPDIITREFHVPRMECLELNLPGIHNISNAIAASAIAYYLGLAYDEISSALSSFKGINRRFDKHIDTKNLVYIDDYAHHPEEITATINITKKLYPSRYITVVFQPHLYTRTKNLANEFAASLSAVDDLVLLDIYPAREEPISGVDSRMLIELCVNASKEICKKDELLNRLKNKRIDVLLTLGAGDISTLVEPIKYMLN